MKEFGYQSAIKMISEKFTCAQITVNQAPPYYDYLTFTNNFYAIYIRTENSKRYYDLLPIYSTELNVRNDFKHLFEVDFMTEMANTFTFEGKSNKKKYATMLFKEFIHDGDYPFSSLEDITVKSIPIRVNPRDIKPEFTTERDFYANPLRPFKRKYDNWLLTDSSVKFGSSVFREAKRREIFLDSILNDNGLTPLLRLLIKLWAIHVIKNNLSQEELNAIEFLNVKNLDEHLEGIERKIHENIDIFLTLKPQERRELFSARIDNIDSKASRRERKLIQTIPLLRLFYGHEDFDLNAAPRYKVSRRSLALFYIKKALNYSILKKIFFVTKPSLKKTYDYAIKGIIEKDDSFMGNYFQMLKWFFTLLWTPFICAYFAVSGLTSMPTVLLRRLFGVKLGGGVDKLFTILECFKDVILLISVILAGGMMIGSLGTALLGSAMLQVGTNISIGILTTISVAFFLMFAPELLLDKFFGKFPRWTSYNGAKPIYETESLLDRSIFNPLAAVMSIPVISVHLVLLGFSFATYSSLTLLSIFARKIITLTSMFLEKTHSSKFNSKLLRFQIQNLNHPQAFRRLLAALAEKVDNSNYTKAEQTILTDIHACMLTENQKAVLNRYLDSKLADPDIENKSVYRLAKNNVGKKGYFLSWKLANEIASDNLNEAYASLAAPSRQAQRMYHSIAPMLSTT